jgi:hypothetical protein
MQEIPFDIRGKTHLGCPRFRELKGLARLHDMAAAASARQSRIDETV